MNRRLCLVLSGLLFLLWGHASADAAQQLLAQMTLREKIEQMFMVDLRLWDENPPDEQTEGYAPPPFTQMNDQVHAMLAGRRFGAVICFSENLNGAAGVRACALCGGD